MSKEDFKPVLEKKRFSPVTFTALGLVAVIGAFVLWQADPLYRWIQKHRALTLIDDIDQYIKEEDWGRGYAKTIRAFKIAPDEPEILRAAARFFWAAGASTSHTFLNRLVELGDATFEDRKMLVEALLRGGDLESARLLNNQLFGDAPGDVKVLALQIQICRDLQIHDEAERLLDRLLEINPGDEYHRLVLAKLLVKASRAGERAKGWSDIWALAATSGKPGIEAIELLIGAQPFSDELEKQLNQCLEQHPLAEERHHIMALERRLTLHPDRRNEFIAAALEKRRGRDVHDITDFFSWLSREGEYPLILENLSFEQARHDGTLLPVYLFALGHGNRWEEVMKILQDFTLPMAPGRQYIFMALASRKLGEDSFKMEEYLHEARRAAKRHGSSEDSLSTGIYAENFGLDEFAEMAYELALQSDDLAGRAYQGLIRLAERSGDTLKLRSVSERFRWRFPNPGHTKLVELNNYLNALTGVAVERSLHESLILVEKEPLRNGPRITAALAYYRLHDLPSAARICRGCKIDELPPGQKAVCAAVAAGSGQEELAAIIAKSIANEALLREERQLILPWIPTREIAAIDEEKAQRKLTIHAPGSSIPEGLLLEQSVPEFRRERNQTVSLLAFLAETEMLLYSGRGDEARRYLQGALDANPAMAPLHIALADLHAKMGNHAEAIDAAGEAIRIAPDNAQAYAKRGASLTALERFEEAIRDFEKITVVSPDRADGYLLLADLYKSLGRTSRASQSLSLALERQSGTPSDPLERAIILTKLERWDEAVARCREALAVNPKDAYASAVLGRAYQGKGMLEEAEAALREATALDPEDLRSWEFTAEFFAETGQPEKAILAYREILRRQPGNRDVREILIKIYGETGHPELASYNKGFLAYSAGDQETALKHYREALDLNPRLKPALLDVALIYLRDNKPGMAEVTALEALHVSSQDPLSWDILGQAILAQGDARGAVKAFERAIELTPTDPRLLYQCAVAYLRINDKEHAAARLKSALASNKPFPQEAEARRLVSQLDEKAAP